MTINAILLDEKDNVVTCVQDVKAGDEVVYRAGDNLCTLIAAQPIPACHKVALQDIGEGEDVIKYGEMIGRTSSPIAKGCHVNEYNIYSVPRDYDSELV